MHGHQNVTVILFFIISPFVLIITVSFLALHLSFCMNTPLRSLSAGCGACGEVK